MSRKDFEKYELNNDAEIELWKDAIIIFDTSALIDFYHYSEETRKKIFEEVFPKLKNRLWIPSHVQFEYLKNRKNNIEKPIASYTSIISKKLSPLIKAKDQIINLSNQIKEDTSTSNKHPYLPQDKIEDFITFTKQLEEQINQLENDLKENIERRTLEIKTLSKNDTILEAIEKNFEVGKELTFPEIMNIVTEGKLRYEFKIPPGYSDEDDKEGTQIFGDLIIWKEILAHSKHQKANVILVSNDQKIDWCGKKTKDEILSPRLELIKEFNDNNGKRFWMYNQSQFSHRANKHIEEIDITDSQIEEISNVIKNRNIEESIFNIDDLVYICGNCKKRNVIKFDKINLEFECTGKNERNMGAEYQHDAEHFDECSHCNNDIQITFSIYEYPEGAHNYETIGISNGKIVQSPEIASSFWDDYYDEPDEDLFRDR